MILSTVFDCINRNWKNRDGRLFSLPARIRNLSKKLAKGQKLPNRHSSITELMERLAISDSDFPFHHEKVMQKLFVLAAVIPSIQAGLIFSDGITLAGDDTCIHTHSTPYRHKVCDCSEKGVSHCECPRHYSDSDAHWR